MIILTFLVFCIFYWMMIKKSVVRETLDKPDREVSF